MKSIKITNGKIYTADKGKIIEKGEILVKDGKIADVGEKVGDGEIVVDAEGRTVTPGFVESHSHLGLWEDSLGFEGSDGNEAVDPVSPELRAIDAINPFDINFKEAVQGGVTTVHTGPGSANVIGGSFVILKPWGNRIDDMVIKNPSAMKIAFGENPKRVYSGLKKSPSTRMATASILRNTLFKAREYLRKKEAAKEEKDMPDFNLQYEALIPVLKKEIPLKAHAHRADDIFTSIRIAKEFDVKITLDHCTEGHLIADHLAKEGLPALVGPTFGERSKVELKNKTFETPKVLYDAGVLFSIITDSPVIPLEHLALCAGLAHNAGLPHQEALNAITINAAKIIGMDDRLGSITKGKDADIVIHDGDPLKDVTWKVYLTMIDGEVVYQR
ncbi:MAG: amidohydrolase [Tissierellia bacterium]|nr:amidohydrolase [Tissierellia bacterium]